MNEEKIVITAEKEFLRIDTFITNSLERLSRAAVQRLIREEKITLNGVFVKASETVNIGDEIVIVIPPPVVEDEVLPERIELDIIYQDDYIAIINKPSGMVVHPGAGNWSGTLVNALLYEISDLSGIGGVLRPGIVHRLDRDTSGLICIAKNDFAHRRLSKELQTRDMTREYFSLSYGEFENDDFIVDAPIGRSRTNRKTMAIITDEKSKKRDSKTDFTVLERFSSMAFLKAKLYTGRTHQIRVHLNYVGHPVVNDPVYGLSVQKKYLPLLNDKIRGLIRGLEGQALHAAKLVLTHPKTGEEMTFYAPLPAEFEKLLNCLREGKFVS